MHYCLSKTKLESNYGKVSPHRDSLDKRIGFCCNINILHRFCFLFFSDRVTNKLSVQAIVGLSLEFELTVNVNFLPNVFCLPGKVQLKRCDTNMYCHYYLYNPAINIYSHKMLDSYRLANETTSLPLFKF